MRSSSPSEELALAPDCSIIADDLDFYKLVKADVNKCAEERQSLLGEPTVMSNIKTLEQQTGGNRAQQRGLPIMSTEDDPRGGYRGGALRLHPTPS